MMQYECCGLICLGFVARLLHVFIGEEFFIALLCYVPKSLNRSTEAGCFMQ